MERVKVELIDAWTLTVANQLDPAEQLLDRIASLVQSVPALLGELLAVRVFIAAYRSDMPTVVKLAQQAMLLVSPEELFLRSIVTLCLGVACYDMNSDIRDTKRAFEQAYELGKISTLSSTLDGDPSVFLVALPYLGEMEWLQGNLRDASRMYEQARELSEQWGGQVCLARVHWGRASLL